MVFLKLAKKNREAAPKSWDALYEGLIVKEIRKKYSINQELSIMRQRDIKPDEFAQYSEYVEQCKEKVKELMEVNR